ncbi:MAG: hypothetical protein ACRDRK_21480 [Pseudonocardia sp.]
MTSRDILEGNADLLDRTGELLAAMPVRSLTVDAASDGDRLRVDLDATSVEWVTIHVDGRARTSVDLAGGQGSVVIDRAPGAHSVRVEGFTGDVLVASRIAQVGPGTVAGQLEARGRGAAATPAPRPAHARAPSTQRTP